MRNVLFLCTGNSARSILAEVLLDRLGGGRYKGWSAGSFPKGEVNPLALALLRERGLPVEGLRSKSWDEFAVPGAPHMDCVITVCDAAAGEACPVWPGKPLAAHWGIPDPAAATGSEAQRMAEFRCAAAQLEARIERFLAIDFDGLTRGEATRCLAAIGAIEDAEVAP